MQSNHSVAVIFPLHDNRGVGLKALRAWQQQRHAVSKCEIIVVGSGQRRLEPRVQKHLAASDTFITCRTWNEASLYNAGAAAATADWLLFTESHVIPAENAMAMLASRLEAQNADAAVLGSTHGVRSRFSEVDAALCEREQAGPMRAIGLWRCVGLRGFLVRRHLFEQLGRFQERYFRFAETAFALRLVAAGYRLADFHDVVVRHVDSDSINEIWFAMKMGRLGACRFHEAEPTLATAGFGSAVPPRSPCVTTPSQARRLWRQILQCLRNGQLAAACELGRLALPSAPTAVGGWWTEQMAATLRVWRAYLEFMAMLHGSHRFVPATDTTLLDHYALLRQRCAEVGAVQYQREVDQREKAGRLAAVDSLQAGDLEHYGFGFFPSEVWQGRSYCWSRPRGGIRVLCPPGASTIRLDIRPTGQWGARRPRLYVNGSPLPAGAAVERDGLLDVHLGDADAPGGDTILSWTCRPFRPARAGLADTRRLGLAVIGATAMAGGKWKSRVVRSDAA